MRSGRPYMSIGEVLTALKPEFADVSVSKIRFLEAEGLLSPERTASGYRMYYQRDLERLRTILKLQRDSFLPLRVIRERLAAADAAGLPASGIDTSPLTAAEAAVATDAAPRDEAAQRPEPPKPVVIEREPEESLLDPEQDLELTEADLADVTGLELAQIRTLREFGVICEHGSNGSVYFDAGDVAVGSIAREFLALGIDARHLKTLRRAAEQEAGLYEALVAPALKNRKTEARQQAVGTVKELARLSRRLRQAYIKHALRDTLAGER